MNFFYLLFTLYILMGISYSCALESLCARGFIGIQPRSEITFLQNFKQGNITGDNRFIIIRSPNNGNHNLQLGEIIKKTGDRQMLVETINITSHTLRRTTINMDFNSYVEGETAEITGAKENGIVSPIEHQTPVTYRILQGSPRLENVFRAFQSTRARIHPGEWFLPERTREEVSLQKKGYSSFWIRGLDKAYEWLAVRELFIKLRINPRVTHINYFADKIPEHIQYIREGITHLPYKLERQRALEHLEKEAEKAIDKGKVTYKWWIEFNYALSKVLSSFLPRNIKSCRS